MQKKNHNITKKSVCYLLGQGFGNMMQGGVQWEDKGNERLQRREGRQQRSDILKSNSGRWLRFLISAGDVSKEQNKNEHTPKPNVCLRKCTPYRWSRTTRWGNFVLPLRTSDSCLISDWKKNEAEIQTTETLISSQCDAAVVAQADLHFLSKMITTTTARSAQTDSV